MGPILRAQLESGASFDDPSGDLLFELLGGVERGDELFLILNRLGGKSNEVYMQTVRNEDGSWLVERRDGSPDRHFGVTVPDVGAVHGILTAWAFGLEGWQNWPWQRIVV